MTARRESARESAQDEELENMRGWRGRGEGRESWTPRDSGSARESGSARNGRLTLNSLTGKSRLRLNFRHDSRPSSFSLHYIDSTTTFHN